MTPSVSETGIVGPSPGERLLRRSGLAWFLVAVLGQGAFIWMIAAHYGRKTLSGNFAGWNDKPIITGYVPDDHIGNAMFAAHVLLAAIVTLGGLLQLVPAIRRRAPAFHRWNGRLFFIVAGMMALGGLWLTWVRHTYLSPISGIAVSVDGVLILLFATIAWRAAIRRDLAGHRRWALRAFMVVNGVWFLRVGIMAWALTTGGLGMNDTLSGPADIALQFGAYLVPLAVLEAYFRGQDSRRAPIQYSVGGLIVVMTVITILGAGGAVAFMWAPYMT
ncbi:DUF2306 domain-containing protein [Novosphingobium album (ex Liu et al. 2023)]|uniref:DUF2306 domain-containing protein n=1 Tax=Novosphingobium album (ex Liu et al. 2023) TaxID=3031130 RepID=A0ABT5WU92_9SPHN|nr:DUF2306 domain-containing protein [Novosphingobium album (ex Liu et al. 2023)]MDE8653441.1 DUF2306 domain-containing protein [Novosphingobium album (ex Liu et al. 2023)]